MPTMTRSGIAVLLAAALAACGPNISPANYEKITNGMKEEAVGNMLGTPSGSRNDKGTIVVEFAGGEVRRKIYYPPGAEPAPQRHY